MHLKAFPLLLVALLMLAFPPSARAANRVLRVAVLNHSPPMSYVDANGDLAGFNVEIMQALCEELAVQCEARPTTLARVVDEVAAGQFDFAAVSLLATPERRARVAMSKPYYRSISIWFGRPGVKPGAPNLRVALVKGGVQSRYATSRGWKTLLLTNHDAIAETLLAGAADATLLPMATALALQADKRLQSLDLASTVIPDPELAGDVCLSVNPRDPELLESLNRAIDKIKRDGRFDRINTRYVPFRLQ